MSSFRLVKHKFLGKTVTLRRWTISVLGEPGVLNADIQQPLFLTENGHRVCRRIWRCTDLLRLLMGPSAVDHLDGRPMPEVQIGERNWERWTQSFGEQHYSLTLCTVMATVKVNDYRATASLSIKCGKSMRRSCAPEKHGSSCLFDSLLYCVNRTFSLAKCRSIERGIDIYGPVATCLLKPTRAQLRGD